MAEKRARSPKEAEPQGITAISAAGFKSIRDEQRIEVRPLTILAGANSSGKSSIMQPLLLLKQTLETQYDPGALLLDGPNVQITSPDQVLSRVGRRQAVDSFLAGLEVSERTQLQFRFAKVRGKGFEIRKMKYAESGATVELSPESSSAEIEAALAAHLKELSPRGIQWVVARRRCFLYVVSENGKISLHFSQPQTDSLETHIAGIIHVPGLRGNPERTYRTAAVGEHFQGRFNDYVASVIHHWQDSREEAKLKSLGDSLEHLGLTWKVEARQIDAARVELRVGRLPHGRRGGLQDLVSIADVGFGLSQTLPVVVALLVAKAGRAVYLEQPEIHLHPRAQSRMAALLANAAKRGVRVIAETHSGLLLRGVQTLVARGELSSELVKLHWFTRGQDGATRVHSADLDEQGRYGEAWPEDFDEVSLRAESEYLDAVESHS